MKKLMNNLADLIKVKTLVTLAVTVVFCALAIMGKIDTQSVMIVVTMVFGFYFGTQHEKNNAGTNTTLPAADVKEG